MTRLFFSLCLIVGLTACVHAQPPPLVVILLPGTSLQDWQGADAPNLHRLMDSGALAAMNTRTARLPNDHTRETPESAVLTLGAGARAAAGDVVFSPQAAQVPGLTLSAGALYTRRTGKAPARGQSVSLTWPALRRQNGRLGYQVHLGNLAGLLASRGVRLISGGGPLADLITADETGAVNRTNSLTPTEGQCLVWDAGADVTAADALIGKAASEIGQRRGRLIVVSPDAGNLAFAQEHRLTPLLELGGGVPAGLLFSPSTRRAGLVTDTDFAPAVAAYYGLKREDFPTLPFGFAWHVVPATSRVQTVAALIKGAERQREGMRILPYLAVAMAVWMLLGTALALKGRLPWFWPVAPAVLLAAILFSNSPVTLAIWSLLLMALAWYPAKRFGPQAVFLCLLFLVTTALMTDILTGSRLMRAGLLGYSAIEGARYYGIGNEAMGALIGSLLVLASRGWQRLGVRRGWLLVLLGVVSLLLGSSNAGAKAGGLLVSLAAFGTLGMTLLRGRWSVRAALILGGLIVAVMACVALGEAFLGLGAHSHIGEAVRRVQWGGLSEASDILTRKLAVEGRLASHSAWACPLWGGLLCLGVLWRSQAPRTTEESALRVAGAVSIAACIALNDAGVVAGAFCILPLWSATVIIEKPLERSKPFQGPVAIRDAY